MSWLPSQPRPVLALSIMVFMVEFEDQQPKNLYSTVVCIIQYMVFFLKTALRYI